MESMDDTPPQPLTDAAKHRALVVDDERPLVAVVVSYLERENFEVAVSYDGVDALARAREFDPDVVILDLGLPGMDGIEVCRELRTFSDAYVVMLTARIAEMDKIIGLSVGADDYVTKPFSPRELVARIRAMLRRPRNAPADESRSPVPGSLDPRRSEAPPRVFGALQIDVAGREVRLGERPVMLTRTEFDVLAALSSRPGMAFSRRQLIDSVWGESWVGNEHLVDVHVGNLRRKLGDDPVSPRYVTTIRGIGYRMGTGQ
ncbi:response regulator transcription factor [Rhodococcus xishaensis]|uniref:DNA-binding response regulator n=1 Tax=Rhodococcus xishaensis TaxID=2487364 RepID=A0A3S3AEU6_9NOCA|nr:response regulator transcription factor [Rhodococcus xishaensis]RVW02983.1 DNA-binding response regulator [Rhodococcus xishaensis]